MRISDWSSDGCSSDLAAVLAFVHLVVVAFGVYVASWTGWLMNADKYEDQLSQTQYTQVVTMKAGCEAVTDESKQWQTAKEEDASGVGEAWQSLRSLASYHHDLFIFHTNFLDCSEHTYQSQPEGWLVLNRPVGRSEEHTSELQSLMRISYAVFCLKKKK